jgi:hypothetical protein
MGDENTKSAITPEVMTGSSPNCLMVGVSNKATSQYYPGIWFDLLFKQGCRGQTLKIFTTVSRFVIDGAIEQKPGSWPMTQIFSSIPHFAIMGWIQKNRHVRQTPGMHSKTFTVDTGCCRCNRKVVSDGVFPPFRPFPIRPSMVWVKVSLAVYIELVIGGRNGNKPFRTTVSVTGQ